MNTLVRLWRTAVDSVMPLPPVEPGTGQAIQAREQEAARERMRIQARRRAAEHLYDWPIR